MPIRHRHGCKHAVILCLLLIGQGCAQLFRLANNVFSDNMVLQMEPKRAHIWGYGTVGARIEITMDSGDSIATTFVQGDAKWIALLPPQPPGGPHLIAIEQTTLLKQEAKAVALLQDVMFGDVWVCAGEGNMELAMRNIFNATQEMEAALAYTNIRVMQIKQHASSAELDELQGVMLPWGSLTRGILEQEQHNDRTSFLRLELSRGLETGADRYSVPLGVQEHRDGLMDELEVLRTDNRVHQAEVLVEKVVVQVVCNLESRDQEQAFPLPTELLRLVSQSSDLELTG
ncbi:hypothetical protein B566_EDAN002506 [Ephemera danica]|nr:hypothetical protein B566_EDAN002506 [Ephemera danica]